EAFHSLDAVVEHRSLRLQSVGGGLPASLWSVVLIGAVLSILPTYLFWIENLGLHALLVALLATFIALLVFLTAAMDNPFRGEFSVSPDAFQILLDKVMTTSPAP
ncbi:bestrophin-like domain, partial [Singulisphaera rosea]